MFSVWIFSGSFAAKRETNPRSRITSCRILHPTSNRREKSGTRPRTSGSSWLFISIRSFCQESWKSLKISKFLILVVNNWITRCFKGNYKEWTKKKLIGPNSVFTILFPDLPVLLQGQGFPRLLRVQLRCRRGQFGHEKRGKMLNLLN
jgi:hypothetical protein